MARRFLEVGGDTFHLEPIDVLADDAHMAIMFRTTGERDGKRLDVTNCTFVTLGDDGRWDRCWWLPNDQEAYDDYWR